MQTSRSLRGRCDAAALQAVLAPFTVNKVWAWQFQTGISIPLRGFSTSQVKSLISTRLALICMCLSISSSWLLDTANSFSNTKKSKNFGFFFICRLLLLALSSQRFPDVTAVGPNSLSRLNSSIKFHIPFFVSSGSSVKAFLTDANLAITIKRPCAIYVLWIFHLKLRALF
jgi:hypothetical protein